MRLTRFPSTPRPSHRAAVFATGMLALALTACGDGTAPRPVSLDAARVDASLTAAQRATTAPAVASFLDLSALVAATPGMNTSEAVAGVRAVLAARGRSPAAVRDAALVLGRAIDTRAIESAVPLLPTPVLGATFVWSPITQGYVPAPERTGAPANGVRFVLYAVNPVTKQPVVDAEVGYADLTDEGASVPNRLAYRLRVVSGGVTYLDYAVVVDLGITGATVGVNGFATDGTTQLDFDIDVGARVQNGQGVLDVAFAFDVPAHDFHTRATVRLVDAMGGSADVAMKVISVRDTIDVSADFDAEGLDASFRVNGELFATATGDPEHPVIRGAGGRELSAAEMAVLGAIVQLIDSQFALLEALLAPLGDE